MNKEIYDAYITILREELVPAMGCTEPIAVAYAAALARKTLGCLPESVVIRVSANIIKNVKSVVVPHTGGLRGIAAAASAGGHGGSNLPREIVPWTGCAARSGSVYTFPFSMRAGIKS